MNIQSHHVSQTVGHKQSVRPRGNSGIHVTLHQSQILQTLSQHFTNFKMHVLVSYSRTGNFHRFVVTSQHDIVHVLLPLVKSATHGNRTRKVRTIIHVVLRAGIRQHHPSHGQRFTMIVIVQRFAILGKNHGERNHTPVRSGNSLDQPGDILLFLSRQSVFHGSDVHLVTDVTGQIYLLYLALFLHGTQRHDSLDQFQRRVTFQ